MRWQQQIHLHCLQVALFPQMVHVRLRFSLQPPLTIFQETTQFDFEFPEPSNYDFDFDSNPAGERPYWTGYVDKRVLRQNFAELHQNFRRTPAEDSEKGDGNLMR